MSANAPGAGDDRPANRSSGGSAVRRPTAWLAAFGVVILLAAAFALSYDAFVALARAGGVNPRLARYYPGVFDATLVVAFAALFVLRTARVYVRLLTWLSAVLVLALCAAPSAAYAAEIRIPARPLAIGVAVAPFVLLALVFRLWLTMLRHIRRGAAARRRGRDETRYADYASAEPPAVGRGSRSAPPLALPAVADSVPEAGPAEAPVEPATARPEREAPVRDEEPEPAYEPEAAYAPEPAFEPESGYEPEPVAYEAESAPAYELEPEFDDQPEPAVDTEHGLDVRDEQAPADEPSEPTLEDLAAVVELADLDEPVASLEPDEADLDETRPPLPRRRRARPSMEFGDEDELVADEGPQSDPVSDEAEPDDEPARANEADEVDEFAEFESDDVPPPPSHRVRSSPLPPLDWGPGLGGLTGRRRTPRANGGSDTV